MNWPNRVWIKSGNFSETGEPLYVSREPTPEDKQRRLCVEENWKACAKSDEPCACLSNMQ
jgi:hypothetical protein